MALRVGDEEGFTPLLVNVSAVHGGHKFFSFAVMVVHRPPRFSASPYRGRNINRAKTDGFISVRAVACFFSLVILLFAYVLYSQL